MVPKTKIEWVRNPDGSPGYTLNSKTGCLNHTPEGLCVGGLFPCYAYKLANGRLKSRYLANKCTAATEDMTFGEIVKTEQDPFYPRFWPERLKEIKSQKNPVGIFLDDMADWMGSYWPEEWTRQELQAMKDNPHHRFYTLTKQAQNLHKFSPFPGNCWVGVTATNLDMLKTALTALTEVKASVKYLSLEPLLGRMQEDNFGGFSRRVFVEAMQWYDKIGWLIIGACTGTKEDLSELQKRYPELTLMPYGGKWTLQPKIEWVGEVGEIVNAADRAGIPVFLKDNLRPLFEQVYGQDPHSYYYHNGLRQEMPK